MRAYVCMYALTDVYADGGSDATIISIHNSHAVQRPALVLMLHSEV